MPSVSQATINSITGKVNKAGDTLTGALIDYTNTPTNALEVVSKNFTETTAANAAASAIASAVGNTVQGHTPQLDQVSSILLTGSSIKPMALLANNTLGVSPLPTSQITNLDSQLTTINTNITNLQSTKADVSGVTFTGAVVLAADPTTANQAATKNYVDNQVSGGGNYADKTLSNLTNYDTACDNLGLLPGYVNQTLITGGSTYNIPSPCPTAMNFSAIAGKSVKFPDMSTERDGVLRAMRNSGAFNIQVLNNSSTAIATLNGNSTITGWFESGGTVFRYTEVLNNNLDGIPVALTTVGPVVGQQVTGFIRKLGQRIIEFTPDPFTYPVTTAGLYVLTGLQSQYWPIFDCYSSVAVNEGGVINMSICKIAASDGTITVYSESPAQSVNTFAGGGVQSGLASYPITWRV